MKQTTRWRSVCLSLMIIIAATTQTVRAEDIAAVQQLGEEVAEQGWIVFAGHPAEIDSGQIISDAKDRGPLDLYLVRPDGSELRNITRTETLHEFGGRFLPDGKRLLYRQLPKNRSVNHDLWGSHGRLVIADLDGNDPVVYGQDGEYPWASFGPNSKRIACLDKQNGKIHIFDFATKQQLSEMPSQGVFQQLFWSPDGLRLVGTANLAGRSWNVVSIDVSIDAKTQQATLLTRSLNCTPDWFQGDSHRVIYSNRNPALFRSKGDDYGLTFLMQASTDGKSRKLIYGNIAKHCYFGCTSPDDKYVVFADDPHDGLVVGEMRVLRLADTPIIPKSLKMLKMLYPGSKEGPVFSLKLPNGVPLRGFEPHWTFAEIGASR